MYFIFVDSSFEMLHILILYFYSAIKKHMDYISDDSLV